MKRIKACKTYYEMLSVTKYVAGYLFALLLHNMPLPLCVSIG